MQQQDVDAQIDLVQRYSDARSGLEGAVTELFSRYIKEAGRNDILESLELQMRRGGKPDLPAADIEVLRVLKRRAEADLKVDPPDWTVGPADALKAEVDAYEQRVDEAIRKHLPPTTAPARD